MKYAAIGLLVLCLLVVGVPYCAFAQPAVQQEQPVSAEPVPGGNAQPAAPIGDSLAAADNVTLDFKEADIHNVLKILAQKAGLNIVSTPDVMGTVTIKLTDVPWERALDIILKSNGFGFQRQGNVILVTKIENMAKIQSDEPLRTEVVHLKFLDAQDAQRILIPMLSARGKVSILYTRGQKGWQFGSFKIGGETAASGALQKESAEKPRQEIIAVEKTGEGKFTASKIDYEPSIKSKTLLITDTDSSLDRIVNQILPKIDRRPRQVLIEAKIMEVNTDKLKDIGFDYATGQTGAESTALQTVTLSRKGEGISQTGAGSLASSLVTPSAFGPKASNIAGAYPYNLGLELMFRKLTGTEFEIIMHALEEDLKTNTLSAPRILTLDNQEASMLVGYHTPILKAEVSSDSTSGTSKLTQSLDYYQEIGIRLNVVPQISQEGYINMIIHPSITSSASSVSATSYSGTTNSTISYPIIDVREAQTQILMKDSETIVIGGLLKDVKTVGRSGIPFLGKIPLLGIFFSRETVDVSKVDLLIFITARIVDEDYTGSADELKRMEKIFSYTKKGKK
ncbi:MAG TPA: secretin and TonB N-terminal domain-containing protein [Candidatus Omnitrophota bacterium]|nr:secretin and TonB N-terminal domain-containing protein [Candidatus Omnitrophota bacterium]HQO38310.1 secretin and TonB N-terminal domain-containing protein [Candidatus Omnitrophota bacterium]HQQ06541.1 secretin and TonB N-terminal domain-containing protein [Candidatus Omnitrophota bacterium]